MRCSLQAAGIWPAIGAIMLLVNPPASATTIVLRAGLCGSAGSIDIPVGRTSGRSREEGPPCASGCHAIVSTRKRGLPGDDPA